jgi:hypothetical protein
MECGRLNKLTVVGRNKNSNGGNCPQPRDPEKDF